MDETTCTKINENKSAVAAGAFAVRKQLLTRDFDMKTTKRTEKSPVWSDALCGVETQALLNVDIKRLEAFYMWLWRRMERISWTEAVLQMVGENRCH